MDESSVAQARGQTLILCGGYPGEHTAADPAYGNWVEVPEGHGSITTWYEYADSNSMNNDNSSILRVYVTNEYDISYDDENNMVLNVTTTADRMERRMNGNPHIGGTANRDVAIMAPDGSKRVLWRMNNLNIAVAGTINIGFTLPARTGIKLAPGESTNLGTFEFWNIGTGYGTIGVCNVWADNFQMGLMFQNNMPTKLDPPVLLGVTQTPDICENFVDGVMTFQGPSMNGVKLHLEWGYDGQDVSTNVIELPGNKGVDINVLLSQLVPTNHTWNPININWRAKWMPTTAKVEESDWSQGSWQVMFILHPHETVPDISKQECNAISKGELLPRYESEVCYSEWSCADQPNIRDKLLEKMKQENKECRIMNGVATTEDLQGGN